MKKIIGALVILLVLAVPAWAKIAAKTSTGNISHSVTLDKGGVLRSVRLHLGAAGASGTLTVRQDSHAGAAFDTVLYSRDMTGVTDIWYAWQQPVAMAPGDAVLITWTDPSGTVVWTSQVDIQESLTGYSQE